MCLPTSELVGGLNSFEKVQVPSEQVVKFEKACIDQPHSLDLDHVDVVATALQG